MANGKNKSYKNKAYKKRPELLWSFFKNSSVKPELTHDE